MWPAPRAPFKRPQLRRGSGESNTPRLPASHGNGVVALMVQMDESSPVNALRRSASDPDAFGAFYRHHVAALFAYLMRRVFDPDVAMDLTSETFAEALRTRHRFRGRTDREAAAWLYRIASRQLARYFRTSRIELRALKRLGIDPPQLDAEQHSRIDDLSATAGLRAALRAELELLSQPQQDALRLRVVDELPYAEVAKRLEISEEAARARVMRGLKALSAAMRRDPLPEEIGI